MTGVYSTLTKLEKKHKYRMEDEMKPSTEYEQYEYETVKRRFQTLSFFNSGTTVSGRFRDCIEVYNIYYLSVSSSVDSLCICCAHPSENELNKERMRLNSRINEFGRPT